MSLLSFFLSFLFPNRCHLCGKEGRYLCLSCRKTILYSPYQPDRGTIAFYAYQRKGLKHLLWLLKYHGHKPIAEELGSLLADALLPELEERVQFEAFTEPVVIPIPLSKKSRSKRGYNQVSLIAHSLIAHAPGTFVLEEGVLLKSRETKRQAKSKNKRERFKNIEGSFLLEHPEKIAGKNVILLDDVTTTGATFDEATKVLLRAKPRKILRVALAH